LGNLIKKDEFLATFAPILFVNNMIDFSFSLCSQRCDGPYTLSVESIECGPVIIVSCRSRPMS